MSTAIIRPSWSPLTIGLMVLGFIFWWPLGLAMLGYILWGEHFGGSAEKAEDWVSRQRAHMRDRRYRARYRHRQAASGNRAFDEYREAELNRLEEERRRLEDEREEFTEFLRNLHLARDREEFDRFMADREARRRNDPNGEHSGKPEGEDQGKT
ncbi:MAG TPA: DUF2852 domain-containing protein [Devosiaceae bacterium]|nr:DUF2852 domain-containing protein [Devosiaceae bacterium]